MISINFFFSFAFHKIISTNVITDYVCILPILEIIFVILLTVFALIEYHYNNIFDNILTLFRELARRGYKKYTKKE